MTEPSVGARSWSVGPCCPGDEDEILALFNAGFGEHRSLLTWRWRFAANPYGGPFGSIARRHSDGKLVGAYMMIPFQLCVDGRPELAFQGVDLIVHPECRKQGMFEQLALYSYELLKQAGGRGLVAFPNPTAMSYPGFTRILGWQRSAEMRTFSRQLDIERRLRALLRFGAAARTLNGVFRAVVGWQLGHEVAKQAAGSAYEFRIEKRVPDEQDTLWEDCRRQQRLSFWKDAAYMRWRYDQNPDHDFEYACLRQRGRLVAIAVMVRREDAVRICELLVVGRDARAGRQLVGELSRFQHRARARSISFLGHDSGFQAKALERFTPSTMIHNVLLARAVDRSDSLEGLLGQSDAWSLSYGDADFV